MDDVIIHDFLNATFISAFKKYFSEWGIEVKDRDGRFQKRNEERDNLGIIRTPSQGETVVFIQFRMDRLKNWFFEERKGFIREFWLSDAWRHGGHGAALLPSAENDLCDNHVFKAILTMDTASDYSIRQGYLIDYSYTAWNSGEVFIKFLKR